MKERPILFSVPMVRALLAGTKTMTRRSVKIGDVDNEMTKLVGGAWTWRSGADGYGGLVHVDEFGQTSIPLRCPYGVVGDRLWVKETFAIGDDPPGVMIHRADVSPHDWRILERFERKELRWKPAIFMPRRASRIELEVTDVRVERLQDITEDDARAEGVKPFANDPEGDCWTDGKHRTAFQYLWNEINGWAPNSWQSNPWVWCISFRAISHPACDGPFAERVKAMVAR